MGEFTFNPKTHRYYLDGKQMTGVTTVLSVIAKPQLIQWASDQAVDYIEEHKAVWGTPDHNEMMADARKAYAQKRDKAAELGTDVHTEIEQAIQSKIHGLEWFSDNTQVNHFLEWANRHSVHFLDTEVQVYSETLFTAGTYDFSCIIDGKKYLGDIKTSNALYPEYFYQCAAYRMMAEEMGQTDFAGSILVNIKRDGSFNEDEDVIISYSYEDEKAAFLAAHTLYRTTARYKTKWKGGKAL